MLYKFSFCRIHSDVSKKGLKTKLGDQKRFTGLRGLGASGLGYRWAKLWVERVGLQPTKTSRAQAPKDPSTASLGLGFRV